MSPAFSPKVMAPGEGKIVTLFAVRFCYKIVSGDSDGRLAVLEVEIPPKTLVKPHAHSREMGLSQCELRRSSHPWLPGSLSVEVSAGVPSSVQRRRLW
jgi:hypothetical protein